MKRLGLVGLGLAAALLMGAISPLAPVAQMAAGAVRDMNNMLLLLNGTPVALGVLTSTGTSVTQATTAAPFTFSGGGCYQVTCDGAAVITIGATASTDYTSANFGRALSAGQASFWCVRDSDTNISLDTAGTTVNCAVARMR